MLEQESQEQEIVDLIKDNLLKKGLIIMSRYLPVSSQIFLDRLAKIEEISGDEWDLLPIAYYNERDVLKKDILKTIWLNFMQKQQKTK